MSTITTIDLTHSDSDSDVPKESKKKTTNSSGASSSKLDSTESMTKLSGTSGASSSKLVSTESTTKLSGTSSPKPDKSKSSTALPWTTWNKGLFSDVTQTQILSYFKSSSSSSKSLVEASTQLLPPGVILVRGFLSIDEQNKVVKAADKLHEDAPFYIKNYGKGHLHFFLSSFGMHWGTTYSKKREYDGLPVPEIPSLFADLALKAFGKNAPEAVRKAVDDGILPFCPVYSSGLCNFYPGLGDLPRDPSSTSARPEKVTLGKHRDNDESDEAIKAGLPVLSLSVGDSALFVLHPSIKEWGKNLHAHLSSKKIVYNEKEMEISEADLKCEIKLKSGDMLVLLMH